MPELPDLTIYIEALESRILGQHLERVRLRSPFVLRSVEPPIDAVAGRRVIALRRIGKRLVLVLEGQLFVAIHLMIAGRLRWAERAAKPPGRIGLAAFDFPSGTLILTEVGSKRRAAIHIGTYPAGLAALERGGVEPLETDLPAFRAALTRENHTLKRALTDPRVFSGIGNAYSDEILHRARLSPFKHSARLEAHEISRLHGATREVLLEWIDRLRVKAKGGFPKRVTAFHPEMAVHGKHREPCPVCGTEVQRVLYAENEANYCPGCQTDGRLLADRVLSRLMKEDWPRTVEELEERRERLRAPEEDDR